MCYAVRTDYARINNLFGNSSCSVTDDLAVAKEVRRRGGRIEQSTWPQNISTTVASAAHYRRLMHRWFVFTRILVQNETLAVRGLILVCFGIHPLILAALAVAAVLEPSTGMWPLIIVLSVRSATIATLNRIFFGSFRHAPVASVLSELVQPAFMAGSYLNPFIWWRRRKSRVNAFGEFNYL
jgi:ceramide glucosyltransferase